jgi:glycosyltransferase involved in cell wall biosynthesis
MDKNMKSIEKIKEFKNNSNTPSVSCIIPSSRNVVEFLIKDLEIQEYDNFEIILCKGFNNPAEAKNKAAEIASGEVLVFIDDDVRIPNIHWLRNLVKPIIDNYPKDIGIIGSAFVLPTNSTKFEKWISREFDRIEFPETNRIVESDLAGANCLAIKKNLFNKINGFNVNFITSEDNFIRYVIRQLGLKSYIAPFTLLYHPRPKNYIMLLRKYIWYYHYCAKGVKKTGISTLGRKLDTWYKKIAYFLAIHVMLIIDLLYDRINHKFRLRPLYASTIYIGRLSYIWGWIK